MNFCLHFSHHHFIILHQKPHRNKKMVVRNNTRESKRPQPLQNLHQNHSLDLLHNAHQYLVEQSLKEHFPLLGEVWLLKILGGDSIEMTFWILNFGFVSDVTCNKLFFYFFKLKSSVIYIELFFF